MGGEAVQAVGVLAQVLDEGLLGVIGGETPDAVRHIPRHITGQQG